MESVFASAAMLSKVTGDMRKCLQCSICLNTISDPMVTPCGHRFCRECIQTVLQNKNTTCPLCNAVINRRNIYADGHIAVYLDRFNDLIQAIKMDLSVDVVAHLTTPRSTRESCSSDNTERCESNVEDQMQPSCSYVNTSLPVKQYGNRASKKAESKESKKKRSKKRDKTSDCAAITKYITKYGLSVVELLPPVSNDSQERNLMEEKVHSWLKSLQNNVPLNSPNRSTSLQPVNGNLDDTLTMSISQIANNKMEMFDVDAVPVPGSTEQRNTQDCRHTSRSSLHENDENDLNRKKEHRNEKGHVSTVELSMDNRKICASGGTKVSGSKERSDERSSEVPRTSTCNMLPTMKQNWSSVARFGKEMRTKRKKLKTLNVSIENIGKARSPNKLSLNKDESVRLQFTIDTGERRKRRRRSAEESKATENIPLRRGTLFKSEESLANVGQETELPSSGRGDRSMPSIFEPVGELLLVGANQSPQNRTLSVDNSQRNEEQREEKITNHPRKNLLKKYVELFETSLVNRSKTPTPTKTSGFHPLQADLVNESSSNRNVSSSTPTKTIERTEESCSASRLQASPLNRSRLSLKRRATDPKADDSSCTNADSRLQAVRRDLNHQIDQSGEGNADARKASTVEIIGHQEENGSSRCGKRDERGCLDVATSKRRGNRELNESMVTFKKLGKVYKQTKKRVRFLYLGPTRRIMLFEHNFAGHSLQKLHNTVDALEQTRASQSGFGNDVYITVNDTPTLNQEDNNAPSVSKADSNRFVDQEQTTVQKNLNRIVDSDTAKLESTDMLVVSLDEVQPTHLPIERSTKSKKTPAGIKMLSPTKDSQLRFLAVDSPTTSCAEADSLRTKKLIHRSELAKDDDRQKRSSFSEIRGAHSRALIRTSQQASTSSNSTVTVYPKKKRSIDHRQLFSEKTERKSERTSESDNSDHSLSSQKTYVRSSQKETPLIDRNNEPCRSSNHSTKDIETVSLNSDTDIVASGNRKLHRKPLLLDSSGDSPKILRVNTVNELTAVSPSSKRKRAVSPDSETEVDLIEIASNWYADAKSGERCKKKGKVDGSNWIDVVKDSFDHSKLADRSSSKLQNKPRAKLLGALVSEKSNFSGNNWRQAVEKSALFDEDSPDFGATIDKIKDIRNRVIGEPDGRAKDVRDECLMQDNFDDIMANVDTDALVDEYCDDERDKRDVKRLEQSNRDSKTSVVDVRGSNGDALHMQRSNKRRKSNLLTDSDDEDQRTLVPECAAKSFRNDQLQEKLGPNEDEPAENKSVVNDKDSYDSLMNITQHYLMIKQFEEDLFEKCKSSDNSKKKQAEITELKTPPRIKNDAKPSDENKKDVEHSGEEDDIVENTPDTKTKSITHAFNSPRESTVPSPIAKITEEQSSARASTSTGRRFYDVNSPACKRSIHPLYQSTPKAQQSTLKNNHRNLNESTKQTNGTTKINLAQSVSNVDKQKFCFVCSGLVSSQIENVKRLAQMVNARYLSQFDRDVTHVIVRTDENNGASKTLKYLQGVAYGKWIVSYQWVMDSLKERRLISEKPYEAVDNRTLEAGPRKSRLREGHLFDGFTFLCIGPYDDVTVEQYQDLLRATGGIVVDSLDALAAEEKRWKIIVIQADVYDQAIIEWYNLTQAIPIVHDWIVECISRYKLISFYPYLQELSRQDVLNLGYPEFLIEEEPDEDLDNTADTST